MLQMTNRDFYDQWEQNEQTAKLDPKPELGRGAVFKILDNGLR